MGRPPGQGGGIRTEWGPKEREVHSGAASPPGARSLRGEETGEGSWFALSLSIRKRLQTEGKVPRQGQEEAGEGGKRTDSGVETREIRGPRKGRYQESGMSEISLLWGCFAQKLK